jgi:hypothetical protein
MMAVIETPKAYLLSLHETRAMIANAKVNKMSTLLSMCLPGRLFLRFDGIAI